MTIKIVAKAIINMKNGKAAGPLGAVAEMLKASDNIAVWLVTDLANDMMRNGTSHLTGKIIINIYNGKGDAVIRVNYRGLKLLDLVMKENEKVMEKVRVSGKEYSLQFSFMPSRGTTDAILILRQLQEDHVDKNQNLYRAFVDLGSAFDLVPRKVIWWVMQKLGIEEWIVQFVQAMYNSTRSKVRVLH